MRKDSLVLNQGGVPLKPTNGLIVEKDVYSIWFYAVLVGAFAYYCICLCILFSVLLFLLHLYFSVILRMGHCCSAVYTIFEVE